MNIYSKHDASVTNRSTETFDFHASVFNLIVWLVLSAMMKHSEAGGGMLQHSVG